jgi:hypothetical protein
VLNGSVGPRTNILIVYVYLLCTVVYGLWEIKMTMMLQQQTKSLCNIPQNHLTLLYTIRMLVLGPTEPFNTFIYLVIKKGRVGIILTKIKPVTFFCFSEVWTWISIEKFSPQHIYKTTTSHLNPQYLQNQQLPLTSTYLQNNYLSPRWEVVVGFVDIVGWGER